MASCEMKPDESPVRIPVLSPVEPPLDGARPTLLLIPAALVLLVIGVLFIG